MRLCGAFLVALSSIHAASASNSLKPPVLPIAGYGPARLRRAADWAVARRLEDEVTIFCGDPTIQTKQCKEGLQTKIKEYCSSTDATEYMVHGEVGAMGWIRGMNGLAGSPNNVQKLLTQPLNADNIIALAKDTAKSLWFWYIFWGFALIWLIVAILWMPALCCKKCRKCYGKCFCQGCCHKRLRAAPFQLVTRTKMLLFLFWFLLGVTVLFIAFIVLSIVFGVFVFKDVNAAPCVAYKASVVALYGDAPYKNPPTFGGVVGVSQDTAKIALNLLKTTDVVEQEQKTLIPILKDYSTNMDKNMSDTFDATKLSLTNDVEMTFDPFVPGVPVVHTIPQFCLPCELMNQSGPLKTHTAIDDAKAAISKLTTETEKHMKDIASATAKGADAADDIHRILENSGVPAELITLIGQIERYFIDYKWARTLLLAVLVVVPGLVFLIWLFNGIYFGYWWKKHGGNTQPPYRRSRNWAGCLCFLYSFMGIFLLFFGILILVLSQPGAELCKVFYEDFFEDNGYWEVEALSKSSSVHYTATTEACLTAKGNGDLMAAAETDLKKQDHTAHVEDFDAKLAELQEQKKTQFNTFKDKMAGPDEIIKALLKPLVALHYTGTKPTSRWNFIAVKEVVFGGINIEDLQSTVTNGVPQLIASILQSANAALPARVTDSSSTPTTTTTFQTQTAPNTIYGIDAQIAAVNKLISKPVSGGPSTCNPLCKLKQQSTAASPCLLVDGTKSIMYPSSITGNAFDLNNIRIDGANANKGDIEVYLKGQCFPGLKELAQFVASFNVIAARIKIINEAQPPLGDPTFVVKTTGTTTPKNTNAAVFRKDVEAMWEVITTGEGFIVPINDSEKKIVNSINVTRNLIKEGMDCRPVYEVVKGATDVFCRNFVYDLGMVGLGWSFMALGAFIAVVLTWRVFHFFADLRAEEKHYSSPKVLLAAAEEGDHLSVMKCCRYQDPKLVKDEQGNTSLHLAAYGNHSETCTLLLDNGVDPDNDNKVGYSALHVGVTAGSTEAVHVIVQSGADTRKPNCFGDKPLHTAARAGDAAMINALLEVENADDQPPRNADDETPIDAASRVGKHDAAKRLADFFSSYTPMTAVDSMDDE